MNSNTHNLESFNGLTGVHFHIVTIWTYVYYIWLNVPDGEFGCSGNYSYYVTGMRHCPNCMKIWSSMRCTVLVFYLSLFVETGHIMLLGQVSIFLPFVHHYFKKVTVAVWITLGLFVATVCISIRLHGYLINSLRTTLCKNAIWISYYEKTVLKCWQAKPFLIVNSYFIMINYTISYISIQHPKQRYAYTILYLSYVLYHIFCVLCITWQLSMKLLVQEALSNTFTTQTNRHYY